VTVEDFDEALEWADVVGCLRLQRERGSGSFVPTLRRVHHDLRPHRRAGAALAPETIIMHPGPMNRGVEIDSRVADLPSSVIDAR
jgi:aspartate carbamoyltransferase catalytic subunit